ncbi:(deoxy)nucleoside triphosphate pyrophosphohydrolase [Methanococcoides alaskense]|uniref:8-oxo-dGTP diphosphatase n=1 Tax=Methanococcoides alaskense TaxID=325778 RepID=A0AA90TYD6_9EURY|nr:(deoxy)nucleoside triphosphate pyrophosphohydrolase [Methanococcoides alaskense]MDA0524894.1 (deoxy)nucleoside triphosphate pyrophosphohydrolase [Methanococcoides alaskense]MDR6222192.1 8-oxo-dGTP diphosphatase [Methanococcoides alaskense]
MKHYDVVAAIIMDDDKVLCVQRNHGKYDYISLKYEFPGGKIEPNETREQALERELLEELDLNIEIGREFLTVNHQYPDFSITMHSFICTALNSTLNLKEHIAFKWLNPENLSTLDWAEADLPIISKLMKEY